MVRLNLVDQNNSTIKYIVNRFPDGQQNIILDCPPGVLEYTKIAIYSRLNNWRDLELIVCAKKSLDLLEKNDVHLYVPYICGSRSDRQFSEGSNNYLRDVICPIINSMNFKTVTSMDAHSYSLESCLNNYKHLSMGNFYEWCLNDLLRENRGFPISLISPDIGASKRVKYVADNFPLRVNKDIIVCSKIRDKDGNLNLVDVPFAEDGYNGQVLVLVDDICDGGRTFIDIAKELRIDFHGRLYLIVTHGIFSKGFGELDKYFQGIYCTNSYQDIDSDATGYTFGNQTWEYYDDTMKKIKQLNIF